MEGAGQRQLPTFGSNTLGLEQSVVVVEVEQGCYYLVCFGQEELVMKVLYEK